MQGPGYFISFEGVEGAGKSTQLALARRWLERQGYTVRLVREPGGTPAGDRIRQLLLDRTQGSLASLTELLLFSASRAELVETIIRPALQAGEVVLCDRFTDSTVAYQGFARGIPMETILTLNRLATGGLTPCLTVLLDLPVSVGLQRARARAGAEVAEDRFESEKRDFHEKVREGFLTLAQQFPQRIHRVSADRAPDMIAADIQERIQHELSGHSRA